MRDGESLGGLQQLMMLAVLRLGNHAYGAGIQHELEETAQRPVSISTVYVTLERLEKRGFVSSWLADPTPKRGGKAKRFYELTKEGLGALREARQELERMWDGVEAMAKPSAP